MCLYIIILTCICTLLTSSTFKDFHMETSFGKEAGVEGTDLFRAGKQTKYIHFQYFV